MSGKPDNVEIELLDVEGKPIEKEPEVEAQAEGQVAEPDELTKFQQEADAKLKAMEEETGAYKSRLAELENKYNEVHRFSQQQAQENKRLADLIQSGEKVLVGQAGGRVKAELTAAEAKFRKAYEDGDTEKMLEAQKDIARLSVEDHQVKTYRPVDVSPPTQPAVAAGQPARSPDPKSDAWLKRNSEWWLKDKPMTGMAMGLHEEAIAVKNFKPGTDEYINYIDQGMKKAFPERFKVDNTQNQNTGAAAQQRSAGTVVAPATRSAGGKPTTKVQISPSMEAMARKLNVPLKAYAEEMARLNNG
jgi:hypothetical protein